MAVPPLTECPSGLYLRQMIEHNVLDLYEIDQITLRPYTQWPGHYWLPRSNRAIPCVYLVGAAQVPADWEPNGIETLINDTPEPARQPSRGCVIATDRWRVRFRNYGNYEGTEVATSLREISRRMLRIFPTSQQIYSERTVVDYEALTVYINQTSIYPVFTDF